MNGYMIFFIVLLIAIIVCYFESILYKKTIKYSIKCPKSGYQEFTLGVKDLNHQSTYVGDKIIVYKLADESSVPTTYSGYTKVIPRTLLANRLSKPVKNLIEKLKSTHGCTIVTDLFEGVTPIISSLMSFPTSLSETDYIVLTDNPKLSFTINNDTLFIS